MIAPIGVGEDGATYNVNADMAAGAIAAAVQAKRLLLLTDVAGVLDAGNQLIEELKPWRGAAADRARRHHRRHDPEGQELRRGGRGRGEGVVIVDGRVPHCVLMELLTPHGVGTRIARSAPNADSGKR